MTNPQRNSSFFAKLPPEIRELIYIELWRAAGLVQHIFLYSIDHPLGHARCVIDPLTTGATHMQRIQETLGRSSLDEQRKQFYLWYRGLWAPWCKHWKCEAHPPASPGLTSPFLAPLLTCRQMCNETQGLLYRHLTFSFTSTEALASFLTKTPDSSLAQIRSIHLTWKIPADILDNYFYLADYDGPDDLRYMYTEFLTGEKEKQEHTWARVAQLPALQELRIDMYCESPGERFPSVQWFSPLLGIRGPSLKTFRVVFHCSGSKTALFNGVRSKSTSTTSGGDGLALFGDDPPFETEVVPMLEASPELLQALTEFPQQRPGERDSDEERADLRLYSRGKDYSQFHRTRDGTPLRRRRRPLVIGVV